MTLKRVLDADGTFWPVTPENMAGGDVAIWGLKVWESRGSESELGWAAVPLAGGNGAICLAPKGRAVPQRLLDQASPEEADALKSNAKKDNKRYAEACRAMALEVAQTSAGEMSAAWERTSD